MSKPAIGLFCVSLLGLPLLVGCGSHYSTQEAYDICHKTSSLSPAATDEAFAQCVACYEECGAECKQTGTLPLTFECPE